MIFRRSCKLPKEDSFFLFGARGTGKSSLVQADFPIEQTYTIDLLLPKVEERLSRAPESLIAEVNALPAAIKYIVIEEVQKIPRLLDVVHHLMESTARIFVLTGSNARKLKHGGANLLAGRAFTRHLFPLTATELGPEFLLDQALRWGTLPKIFQLDTEERKDDFLFSYAHTYLKEEIQAEQLVRKVDHFRKFLEGAAQSNGKIVNFANIAKDTGADPKTVKSYYEILEDTLLGFWLEPFSASIRKRLRQSPKFYFFDTGVARALARQLPMVPVPSTSYYGDLFEQLVMNEFCKADAYARKQCRFSYLMTASDVVIDLIIDRPGLPRAIVEIKSTREIREDHLEALRGFLGDFPKDDFYCLSNDPTAKVFGRIKCLHWQDGLTEIMAL